jgi:N-acetylglutamate synthase-like GNAT family acetyltransferase
MGTGTIITTRAAEIDDAERICEVLIRSIREVCGPDYGNDETLLERWCLNKRPEITRAWIADPGNRTIVALDDGGRIVGAGLIHVSGEIRLCYALPEVIGKGVGHALIGRLEAIAREMGLGRIDLMSTSTARPFYERHGFACSAPPEPRGPGYQYPMTKVLAL